MHVQWPYTQLGKNGSLRKITSLEGFVNVIYNISNPSFYPSTTFLRGNCKRCFNLMSSIIQWDKQWSQTHQASILMYQNWDLYCVQRTSLTGGFLRRNFSLVFLYWWVKQKHLIKYLIKFWHAHPLKVCAYKQNKIIKISLALLYRQKVRHSRVIVCKLPFQEK